MALNASGAVTARGGVLTACGAPTRTVAAPPVPTLELRVCTGFLARGLAAPGGGGLALVDNRGTPGDATDDRLLQLLIVAPAVPDGGGAPAANATTTAPLSFLGVPGCALPADQAVHVTAPAGVSVQLNGPLRYDAVALSVDPYGSQWAGFLPQSMGALNSGGEVFNAFSQTWAAAVLGSPPVPAPSPANTISGADVTPTPAASPAPVNTCNNSAVDAGESGVDCGGSSACGRCTLGRGCASTDDCEGGGPFGPLLCAAHTCVPPGVAEAPFLVTLNVTLRGVDVASLTDAAVSALRALLAAAAAGSGAPPGAIPPSNVSLANLAFTPGGWVEPQSSRLRRLRQRLASLRLGGSGARHLFGGDGGRHTRAARALAAAPNDALSLTGGVALYNPSDAVAAAANLK